jgi:histidinol-phosphate aminotransferase
MTMAAGLGALEDAAYFEKNCAAIRETREWTAGALRELGFTMPDSKTNFLFVKHPGMDGGLLYRKLKERRILVRHFDTPKLKDYNRITIGTKQQMEALVAAIREITLF